MTTHAIARALGLAALTMAAACGGGGGGGDDTGTPDAPPAPTGGTAAFVFGVTNGVRASGTLVDPLSGAVYGQIFRQADVTLTGPIEGAVEYGSVEATGVDLTTAQTAGAWTGGDIPAGSYVFLGFFDVDGNGATTREPDAGDPVTLPITNQFDITVGQTTNLTVQFDLVYN